MKYQNKDAGPGVELGAEEVMKDVLIRDRKQRIINSELTEMGKKRTKLIHKRLRCLFVFILPQDAVHLLIEEQKSQFKHRMTATRLHVQKN